MGEREIVPGRNDQCPCGSGRKYKHCCLASGDDLDRVKRHRGHKKAVVATGHQILEVSFYVMRDGVTYHARLRLL